MSLPIITHCPATLAPGHNTYSRTALKRLFNGKKVDHRWPYPAPAANESVHDLYEQHRKRISISGVQEKYSLILQHKQLRFAEAGEQGQYILKPIPAAGKRADQLPANEHLSMQIARQVYGIETAENGLLFLSDGSPAYLTKRFDVKPDGSKWAQEDFAALAKRSAPTHGQDYKYQGHYAELFEWMRMYLPSYATEAPKLLKVLLFNYLFSNGDAHLKNFSVLETPLGDYRLAPAYDLLNSRIHIEDQDFALVDGLLPRSIAQGKIAQQFAKLAELAGIKASVFEAMLQLMWSKSEQVALLVEASFLNESTKRQYWQAYQSRLKQLLKT
jgi:serine/threonine-protein kinase HipA